MAKLIGTKTAYAGRKSLLYTLNSAVAVNGGWTSFFSWIPWDRLTDRMIGIWGMIRRGSTAEEPIFTGRTENLQRLDEIRSRAYLDIRRNIV